MYKCILFSNLKLSLMMPCASMWTTQNHIGIS